MKRLLSIELQKIWQNKASRVLTLTYFVLLSFIALIASINFSFLGINFRIADQGIFNFPYIWHFNTYVASILKFFLAVVIVSMMANEYTYGTLKQNLIDGLSKNEFIKSKLITVILFALGSTIFVFIMSMILGLCFSSYDEAGIIFSDLEYLLAYFVKLVAFFSFCLFLGILVKRSAFALGFLLVWFFFEGIIFGLLRWLVFSSTEQVQKVTAFLPLESMSNLIKEPITRFQAYKAIENQVSGGVAPKDYSVHWYEILIVVVWTVIFMLMSYKILKKRDL
ncbi:ABC-type transport system involved in multi-copper enzyme maturation permease subunit [Flavobacterium gossypii]|uniref:ABC-type transport system involved in multi-copper enzyme maturation permease subunit n=2 Tax=Flavobacterium TaxID=237 RepID=A0A495MHE2_9FLAO|nr:MULTISPECIES: ABC transporter permease [Flavobacterium]MBA9072334.1 ABC-type transport system involved in multi-copper enzyme maturation permease subunit [Flavobacterium gossypii]RKS25384.1 ABC-type transport system involved in multi-copper enzyme maturation permease subunit [Flavobacterium endophyticum]WDO12817.1 ABC transporter permease [Flavobacterium sp. WW92]